MLADLDLILFESLVLVRTKEYLPDLPLDVLKYENVYCSQV